jgi:signal transduction histidine kinase
MSSPELHRPRRHWRLRTGFFLVLLLGAILPLGLVGLWLAQSTQRSAEELVRLRVEAALGEIAQAAGHSWAQHRSGLLRLVETTEVHLVLGNRVPLDLSDGAAAAAWQRMDGIVDRGVLRGVNGEGMMELTRPVAPRALAAAEAALIPVSVPIYVAATGKRLGSLDAMIRAGALLPGDLLAPGVSGSILAIFEPTGGSTLLPLTMDPGLFMQDRFVWGGERWVVARRQLFEPPLVLAMAAPVGDFSGPFEDAAWRGTLALLAVALLALLLTGVVSRRLTQPLGALADASSDIAAGTLDRDVPEHGPDEVRRLARAFNAMTASLQETLGRLSHQEALAAMGQLAASIAHEVRNPLTAVRLDLERAAERLDDDDGAAELVRRALRDIERLDASVGDTLRLARSGQVNLRPIDVAVPIRAAMITARPHFDQRGEELRDLAIPPEPVMVIGDGASLEQLFLNLLLNAADALQPGGEGRVEILQTANEVRVVVRDSGDGMPAEVRERVLEPFFSTKAEGTGLGLPIAQRIALAHGGRLEIESEMGEGTAVAVVLRRPSQPGNGRPPGNATVTHHDGAPVTR